MKLICLYKMLNGYRNVSKKKVSQVRNDCLLSYYTHLRSKQLVFYAVANWQITDSLNWCLCKQKLLQVVKLVSRSEYKRQKSTTHKLDEPKSNFCPWHVYVSIGEGDFSFKTVKLKQWSYNRYDLLDREHLHRDLLIPAIFKNVDNSYRDGSLAP